MPNKMIKLYYGYSYFSERKHLQCFHFSFHVLAFVHEHWKQSTSSGSRGKICWTFSAVVTLEVDKFYSVSFHFFFFVPDKYRTLVWWRGKKITFGIYNTSICDTIPYGVISLHSLQKRNCKRILQISKESHK